MTINKYLKKFISKDSISLCLNKIKKFVDFIKNYTYTNLEIIQLLQIIGKTY